MNCHKCNKEMQHTPICCNCGTLPIADDIIAELKRERDEAIKKVAELENKLNTLRIWIPPYGVMSWDGKMIRKI